MIRRSNKQYANIQTMAELRSARERLAWKIESSEEAIDRQIDSVREMFTLSYWSMTIVRKVESVRSWIGTIYDGYRLAMSFFKRDVTTEDEPTAAQYTGESELAEQQIAQKEQPVKAE